MPLKKGLFIGVNRYRRILPKEQLVCPRTDAEALAKVFSEKLGFNQRVLIDEDLGWNEAIVSVRTILDGWRQEFQTAGGGVLVIYFAGHGATTDDGFPVLLQSNATDRELASPKIGDEGVISMRFLQSYTDDWTDVQRAFIFDACRTSSNARAMQQGGGRTRLGVGIARPEETPLPDNLVVLQSCPPDQVACELTNYDGGKNHGLYTAAFLDLIDQKLRNESPLVLDQQFNSEVARLMSRLAGQYANAEFKDTAQNQRPVLLGKEIHLLNRDDYDRIRVQQQDEQLVNSARQSGTLDSVRYSLLKSSPTSPYRKELEELIAQAEQLAEEAEWGEAEDKNTVAGYKRYLSRHLMGRFADEARSRIKNLESKQQQEKETAAWQQAKDGSLEQLIAFREAWPHGVYRNQADERIVALEKELDQEQWNKVVNDLAALLAVDDSWHTAHYRELAKTAIHELTQAAQLAEELEKQAQANAAEQARLAQLKAEQDQAAAQALEKQIQHDSLLLDQASKVDGRTARLNALRAALTQLETEAGKTRCRNLIAEIEAAIAKRTAQIQAAFKQLGKQPTVKACDAFLAEFAESDFTTEVKELRVAAVQLAEQRALALAEEQRKKKRIEEQAARNLEKLRLQDEDAWVSAKELHTEAGYLQYLENWPTGAYIQAAKKAIDEIKQREKGAAVELKAWLATQAKSETVVELSRANEACLSYLSSFPSGVYHTKVWQRHEEYVQRLRQTPPELANNGSYTKIATAVFVLLAGASVWGLMSQRSEPVSRPVEVNQTQVQVNTEAPLYAPPAAAAPDAAAPEPMMTGPEYLKARADLVRSQWWRSGKGNYPSDVSGLLFQATYLAQNKLESAILDLAYAYTHGRGVDVDEAKAADYYLQWLLVQTRNSGTNIASVHDELSEVLIAGLRRKMSKSGDQLNWQPLQQRLANYQAFPTPYWRGLLAKCGGSPDVNAARNAFESVINSAARNSDDAAYQDAAKQELANLQNSCSQN